MASFLYLTNPARLKQFLKKIQEPGIPEKLTRKVLTGLGFKSTNDRPIIGALKSLGFLDSSGVPTGRWKLYRNKKEAPGVLAEAIKEYYADLYRMYPDAHIKDNEALRNFFSSHTDVSAATQGFMVSSFKLLASLANFDTDVSKASAIAIKADLGKPPDRMIVKQPAGSGFEVNLNIQLTLPEGATPETFEAFFQAMRKHLID